MNQKCCRSLALLGILSSPVFAVPPGPELSVIQGGVQANNWVWEIDITPDLVLAQGSTPVAVELGFRLTGAPLLSAAIINPTQFPRANPGRAIFGWETPGVGTNGHPDGLQVNTSTDEIFVAYGSVSFTTPGPKPFLEIIAEGPSGGTNLSTSIQWLGAYNGKGRIAQITNRNPLMAANFDLYAGFDTQVIPEPASLALAAFGAIVIAFGVTRRRSARAAVT